MRAILFDGKKLKETVLPKPRRRRGEAVVRVHLAGICSTDLEITRGYSDFQGVPGHEFVGTVVSTSSGELIGERVVGEINIPCGKCSTCRRGLGKHCPYRSVVGIHKRQGAFAEYISLPESNLHTVAAGISDEEAAFTELLAAACEIPARVRIQSGTKVAVLGDGRLASMAAQVLALETSSICVLGINRKKLSTIGELGIPAHDITRNLRFKREFDVVVECTGKPSGLPSALELVRPQGTIVLKSTYHGRPKTNLAPFVVDEITVVGSRCGPFDTALGLLATGSVKVLPFLSSVHPFDRWREAFRRARRPDIFKILLDISGV